MTVRLSTDGTIELDGICTIEDAETLHRHLLAAPRAAVDWRSCEQAHTAVIQVLMASRRVVHGPPAGDFLRTRLAPLLKSESA
jgi:hypothetical protein